jgi:hypothetical protein
VPTSFGSLELRPTPNTEYIGQRVDYSDGNLAIVRAVSIDSLKLSRIDFIKIDVEGMEMAVLAGAVEAVKQHRPVMLIESIKTDALTLKQWLEQRGYAIFQVGINVLTIHKTDQTLSHFRQEVL